MKPHFKEVFRLNAVVMRRYSTLSKVVYIIQGVLKSLSFWIVNDKHIFVLPKE